MFKGDLKVSSFFFFQTYIVKTFQFLIYSSILSNLLSSSCGSTKKKTPLFQKFQAKLLRAVIIRPSFYNFNFTFFDMFFFSNLKSVQLLPNFSIE